MSPRRYIVLAGVLMITLCALLPCAHEAAAAQATPQPTPIVSVFDVSQSGVQPPAQQDKAAAFIVIGLNPILGQSIVATQSVKSNNSSGGTQSAAATGPTPKPRSQVRLIDPVDTCANAKPATVEADCTAALSDIDQQLNTEVALLSATSPTDLQTQAANLVAKYLQTFYSGVDPKNAPTTYYTEFTAAPTLNQAAALYARFVSGLTFSNDDLVTISQYGTLAVNGILNPQLVRKAKVDAAMKAVKKPGGAYTSMLDAVNNVITFLQGTTATNIETAANKYTNQIKEVPAYPNVTYYIVNATCSPLGFSSSAWTIVMNQTAGSTSNTPTKVWEDDVTCYPELSAGAMYYASTLSTTSYTLQSKTINGATVNVPVQQNNNADQGSFSGAVSFCPNGGPSAWCGVISLGADTNGLNGGVGGGYMFMHRVIGVYVGARIGQVNVLQKSYTAGLTPVANGANYTYKQINIGGFAGISLNIPTSK